MKYLVHFFFVTAAYFQVAAAFSGASPLPFRYTGSSGTPIRQRRISSTCSMLVYGEDRKILPLMIGGAILLSSPQFSWASSTSVDGYVGHHGQSDARINHSTTLLKTTSSSLSTKSNQLHLPPIWSVVVYSLWKQRNSFRVNAFSDEQSDDGHEVSDAPSFKQN